MKWIRLLSCLLVCLGTTGLCGQELSVEKLPSPVHYDGLDVAPNGDLILTEGWQGSRVFRATPDGDVSEIAGGLKGPVDVTVGSKGELYVSNFITTTITRISPEGRVQDFAEVPIGPTGIVVDRAGNLFVAIFGVGYGTDDEIWKITPNGDASRFVAGHGMTALIGLAIDETDHLYAASWRDGKIFRVSPRGTVELYATVPVPRGKQAIGHVEFCGGELFATCDATLYQISTNGALSVFAAASDGGANPALISPLLRKINGIAATTDSTRLYIGSLDEENHRQTLAIDLDRSPSLQNANRLLSLGKLDQAIPMLQDLVEAQPKNYPLVYQLALALHGNRAFAEADGAYRQAMEAPGLRAYALYNRACCQTRMGNLDTALELLHRAVDAGFKDRETLTSDGDLKTVRQQDGFAEVLRKLDEKS